MDDGDGFECCSAFARNPAGDKPESCLCCTSVVFLSLPRLGQVQSQHRDLGAHGELNQEKLPDHLAHGLAGGGRRRGQADKVRPQRDVARQHRCLAGFSGVEDT